jgi:hypothetical protein
MFLASICPPSGVQEYWAYRCPKHVELFMIINKIVASIWYLSSFLYMMHGHTYIKLVTGCYTQHGGIRNNNDGGELNVAKLLEAISYATYIYGMTMEKFILNVVASRRKIREQSRCLLALVATSLLPTARGKVPPVARPHDTLVSKLHRVFDVIVNMQPQIAVIRLMNTWRCKGLRALMGEVG